MVFHVLNRGVGRMRLFDDDDDYAAFERVVTEMVEIQPMRVCASDGGRTASTALLCPP